MVYKFVKFLIFLVAKTWENIPREKPRKSSLQNDRRMAKLIKADTFVISTQTRGRMAADYGINLSVQITRRPRKEFELCGRIAQKKKNSGIR